MANQYNVYGRPAGHGGKATVLGWLTARDSNSALKKAKRMFGNYMTVTKVYRAFYGTKGNNLD